MVTKTSDSIKIVNDAENTCLENSLNKVCKNISSLCCNCVQDGNIAEINHSNLAESLEIRCFGKNDAAWNEIFLAAQDKTEKSKLDDNKEN